MPDFNSVTTYVYGAIAALGAYVVKTQVEQGKEQVRLRTILEYYVERQTRDAAIRLDVPNPAPPEIRKLLQKHIQGEALTGAERPELITWLTAQGTNAKADPAERSAALQLLTGIKTAVMLKRQKQWWRFWEHNEH